MPISRLFLPICLFATVVLNGQPIVPMSGRTLLTSNVITTLAGNGSSGFSGDGAAATSAQLNYPERMAVDTAGNLYIADYTNARVRKVSAAGIITTVAGIGDYRGSTGDGGPATSAKLSPTSVAVDAAGNLYIADSYNNRIRKVDTRGIITTIAGTGNMIYSGDGGPATAASIQPMDIALDAAGNLYIADLYNKRIRKVTPNGVISTIAGDGSRTYLGEPYYSDTGDGGPATKAHLIAPLGVAVDLAGNVYIVDANNTTTNSCSGCPIPATTNRIRKVDSRGIITTIVDDGTIGFSGDQGPAVWAKLNTPESLAVDLAGNLYITDTANNRIRRVDPYGIISTIAGSGSSGYAGDGGPPLSASFKGPSGVTVDTVGNLYVVDHGNHRIRAFGLPLATQSQAFITATSGTPQTAATLSSFAPLKATVKDAAGTPLSGVVVTFLAQPGTLSGNFNGATSAQVTTDASGIATAPTFTANDSGQGTFKVFATIPTGGTPATFVLTNVYPMLAVSPDQVSFTYHTSGAVPSPQTVTVTRTGAGPFTAAASGGFLSVSPTSGSTPASLTLTVDPTHYGAGTLKGSVLIASQGSKAPITLPVTLTIINDPAISLSATQMNFIYAIGDAKPAAQSFTLTVNGNGSSFAASSNCSWLSVSPAAGPAPSILRVSVNPDNMTTGSYTGAITLTVPGAANSPKTVAVTLTITGAPIVVTPNQLAFTSTLGAAAPVPLSLTLTKSGNGTFTASAGASWLSVSPLTGAAPGVLAVSVDPSGMNAGSYTSAISIAAPGAANSPKLVPVTFTVVPPAGLTLAPALLAFTYQTGGTPPALQTVNLTRTTLGSFVAASDSPWLAVTPLNGSTPAALKVSVNPASMNPGTYNGVITVTSAGAANSPLSLPVAFVVSGPCSFLIQSSTTQNLPVSGGSGLIQIVTAQGCAWKASSAASWVAIDSGTSGSGNGAVSYKALANLTGLSRSVSLLVAGQTVTINQAGGAPPLAPAVTAVTNAASYALGSDPAGLAQGSFFSIFGTYLGADSSAKATTYPLPITLGGTSVQILQGSTTYDAWLVFASSTQLNAIVPSAVPLGPAQVIVTYNGQSSQPANILVTQTSFGIFYQAVNGKNLAIAQNVASSTSYPLNTPAVPARPGQIVIFWGTGLGAIPGGDDVAPGTNATDMSAVPVTITVGGITALRNYAGRQAQSAGMDNLYFTIPSGILFGCQVPVVVTAGGVPANTTLIAVTTDGTPCKSN